MKYKSTVSLATLLIGIVVGGATLIRSNAETSPTTPAPSVQTVQAQNDHQESVLDNHEARITNTESDVKNLQANTNTEPSVVRVEVPVVTTEPVPTPEPPAPEPEPITVVSWEKIPVEGTEDIYCKYTYSDGTTYQWHWQTVEYNQGTKFTYTSGSCDQTAIGKNK
jgi:hypothetical protein